MKKICEQCGHTYDVRPCRYDKSKFCSRQCKAKSMEQKVKCQCSNCHMDISVIPSKIGKHNFCSNKCVGEYNAKTYQDNRIVKHCEMCNKEFLVKPSYQSARFCSNQCQNHWQSTLVGSNANNWRGGGDVVTCKYCNISFQRKSPSSNQIFCCIDCKNSYWIENILHKTEKFKRNHRIGNELAFKQKKQTKPEFLLEKSLLEMGYRNNIDYISEQGFFGRYYADFFIPCLRTIIEVYGDYWHGNDKVFKALNDRQIYQREYDKNRKTMFEKYGFKYIIIWESDIYKDNNIITRYIKPLNDYTQDS